MLRPDGATAALGGALRVPGKTGPAPSCAGPVAPVELSVNDFWSTALLVKRLSISEPMKREWNMPKPARITVLSPSRYVTPRRGPRFFWPLEMWRSEEHTSELQSRFGISYAVFCLKKNT